MDWPAATPQTPYYAVIFTALRTAVDSGYTETAQRMLELAVAQPGLLGVESTCEGEREITVSYWQDLDAIAGWKANLDHLEAQQQGRERWYQRYSVRITRVERSYTFD